MTNNESETDSQLCILSFLPEQRHVRFPVRKHSGHRVPHGYLGSHVEVRIMGKFESQHVGGMIKQNIFPCFAGLRKLSTSNTSCY